MEKLIPTIKKIAARISRTEDQRKRLAAFLKEIAPQANLIKKPGPAELGSLRITAVDGGLVKRSLHGFDCAIVRAAAVCFHYQGSKVKRVEYWPSKSPVPVPEVLETLSDLDWAYAASMMRLREEVQTAIRCIDALKPDLLLLDGSIVPHYADKPSKNSPSYPAYQQLIASYQKLYQKAAERGITLAGVIEDSRSTVFCNLVKSDILTKVQHNLVPELVDLLLRTRDTNLLYLVLGRGERTSEFKYSSTPQEHPVLKDLGSHSDKMSSFYLKTAEFDRPVKVDYLEPADPDRLAGLLLSISGQHPGYGIPAPLIEADNVAKLSDTEMENFYSQILHLTGNAPSIMRLRREQRPF
ncbi:MAG: DNA double-strand break repair nuclease NurA [Candidatus Aenigmatarchaeota archaeon]